ncbi:MAG TPA: hypothetical protein VFB29_00810 [Pseudolabrys sp.]|nr:hypothetical protein [Pseudolabrys sp.]
MIRWFKTLRSNLQRLRDLEARCERLQIALGRIEARQTADATSLADAEFGVFSQWGEDGILQYLIRHVPIERRIFVEFGVQDYSESNTRFLLVNNNWSGLVIDGDSSSIEQIRRSDIFWRHDLNAVCAFVTRENINSLLAAAGIEGDIGLLSIDVDGNDYWIWEGITCISPRIVVVEYNARFGSERAISMPYNPNFVRRTAHYSMIYYGASLAALAFLADRTGYVLVGCNSSGNNAFFVRKDVMPRSLRALTVAEAFNSAQFRESRDVRGNLQYLSHQQEAELLAGLPIVDVTVPHK